MKTSNVLASLFFGSLAVGAPLEKRYYKTKTEVVVVTEVVYTTVYEGEVPSTVAAATTSAIGVFAEQPASSSAKRTSSAAPVYTPPAEAKPSSSSSIYTPPPVSSTSVYTPPAPSSSSVYVAPAPVSSSVYVAPAPASSATPAKVSSATPAQSSTSSTGGGQSYKGDITVYDNTGAPGACGIDLTDDMEICAIAVGLWDAEGGSTYNTMTGASDNPYCGKTATINYGGNTATCVIQDMCPGCGGDDLDLSRAVWDKLTGTTVGSRYVATWSVNL